MEQQELLAGGHPVADGWWITSSPSGEDPAGNIRQTGKVTEKSARAVLPSYAADLGARSHPVEQRPRKCIYDSRGTFAKGIPCWVNRLTNSSSRGKQQGTVCWAASFSFSLNSSSGKPSINDHPLRRPTAVYTHHPVALSHKNPCQHLCHA